jgi:hypothetical protein
VDPTALSMTLLADFSKPCATSRSRPLSLLFFGPRFENDGGFQTHTEDRILVMGTAFDAPDEILDTIEPHQLNIFAWPAPGAANQFFSSCLRADPDTPDQEILASGRVGFSPLVLPTGPGNLSYAGHRYPEMAELPWETGAKFASFQMTFPRYLLLPRFGRFVFFVSLTLKYRENGETRYASFITDPEMDVRGSYPPEPPPPPPDPPGSPSARDTSR